MQSPSTDGSASPSLFLPARGTAFHRWTRFRRLFPAVVVAIIAGCGAADRGGRDLASAPPPESDGSLDWGGDIAPGDELADSAPLEPLEGADPGAEDWGAEDVSAAGPDLTPPEPPDGDLLDIQQPATGMAYGAGAGSASPRSYSETTYSEPSSPISEVDAIVRKLQQGNIAYNAPETMILGESTEIELLLSPAEAAEALRSQLRNPSNAQSGAAQIGNRMEAQLTGSGFSIEELSPALQAISSLRPTQWRWRVTPTSHGLQELHLSLYAHIDVDGRDAPFVIETKDAVIEVENVTIAQQIAGFAGKNWQWLWATVILPVFGYRFRRRKRPLDHEPRRAAA